ncbi:MAG: NAD(P)H-hydrate dehydratase [Candidatus Sumerlaeaceae bacterium]
MKIATADQMRAVDERTIGEFGISADALMLEAGRAVAAAIRSRFAPARVAIVCGKGNNAGDGFVVAHELCCDGVEVDVLCMESAESYQGAACRTLARLTGTQVRVQPLEQESTADVLSQCELVVDALLGTGIHGPLLERYASAAQAINHSRRPVVCIDIASGLGEFSIKPDAIVVKGTLTVAIGLPKLSQFSRPGIESSGELLVAPIQFPHELLQNDELQLNWARVDELRGWLPKRAIDSNKGTFGSVGVVAGSAQFAGAAILLARAALRAGCGLVTIFCPAELNAIYKVALPEATTWIVPSKDGQSLDSSSAESILEKAKQLSVLAMGPGLGTGDEQRELLIRVLGNCSKPVILDADAITLVAAHEELRGLLKRLPDCVLTPHPGEMGRLISKGAAEVQIDRVAAVDEATKQLGIAVLLKGAGTLLGRPDGQKWIVRGGTSALAKGGTGDVLSGVIASLVAQGMPCWQALVAAATAHVEAGVVCAEKSGERGVLAGEVADEIPRVFASWNSTVSDF